MKKRLLVFFLAVLLFVPLIFATSVDEEIQKLTSYAEEYESGAITWIELQLRIAAVRSAINSELGAIHYQGGLLNEDEIESSFGEPTGFTRWAWSDGEDGEGHDVKLDEKAPFWEDVVFDGNVIQIMLEAHPFIFKKRFDEEHEEKFNGNIEDGDLVYQLGFMDRIKKPEDQIDISGKIEEITFLAEAFDADPSSSNAETLAEESVNAEKMFRNYFEQNPGQCEDKMDSIFGSENKRESQEIEIERIEFYGNDELDVIINLESCEKCEWSYFNFDARIETRGMHPGEGRMGDSGNYGDFSVEEFKGETKELLSELKSFLESGNIEGAFEISNDLRRVSEEWNKISNVVWEEVEESFDDDFESMTDEEKFEFDQDFGWVKRDQEIRQEMKRIQEANFNERRAFYDELFSGYEIEEDRTQRTDYEKRLLQTFKIGGEEVCDNDKDDNEDEQIDCADSQCGGQICGKGTETVVGEDGIEIEREVDFYCIEKVCQAKEKIEEVGPVCGNNICEVGEDACLSSAVECEGDECSSTSDCGVDYCPNDCSVCIEHPAIECDGKVIFAGEDEIGCALPPICIDDEEICEVNEDCAQPLCGVAECLKSDVDETGFCVTTELKECLEAECFDGEEKKKKCDSGDTIISEVCIEGLWTDTDITCEGEVETDLNCVSCGDSCAPAADLAAVLCMEPTYSFECIETSSGCEVLEIVDFDACVVKEDCGGENDVCSNGECVTIPEVIQPEPVEEEEIEEIEEVEVEEVAQEEVEEESPEEDLISGNVIFRFFNLFLSNLRTTGMVVDGDGGDGGDGESGDGGDSGDGDGGGCPDPGEPPEVTDECWYEETYDDAGCVSGYDYFCDESNWEDDANHEDFGEFEDEWEDSGEWEEGKWEEENKQRCEEDCEMMCYNQDVKPCVEECIWDSCGDDLDCDIDAERITCEDSCSSERDSDCQNECVDTCISGDENWWESFEREPEEFQEEKGVFQVGGGCMVEEGRTEGFVWFGGWGEPFEDIEPLKQKYYGGEHSEWCKNDAEEFIKKREMFQEEFNQEFLEWFLDEYLANSAEDWEEAQEGIYEIFWDSAVRTQMELAFRMRCLDANDITDVMDVELINIAYETDAGKIEYSEKIETVEIPELGSVTLVTPEMKIWLLPNKEVVGAMMGKAMENREFPGPPEERMARENQGGPTPEEVEMIKQDERFMRTIEEVSSKYGGSVDAAVQFVDFETDKIIFNMFTQVNPDVIMRMEPMPVSELGEVDFTLQVPFNLIYEMIRESEEEMNGERIETAPWSEQQRGFGETFREFRGGAKNYFAMRKIIKETRVLPESAEKDGKEMFKLFFKMMGEGERDDRDPRDEDEGFRGGEDRSEWHEDEGFDGKGGFGEDGFDDEFSESEKDFESGEGDEGWFFGFG